MPQCDTPFIFFAFGNISLCERSYHKMKRHSTYKRWFHMWNIFQCKKSWCVLCWGSFVHIGLFKFLKICLEPMTFKFEKAFKSRCRNPSLGLTTKARACKGTGQEGILGMWESVKMNTHTPKWAPMLGVGVPVDSQIFKERLLGSKPIGLGSSLYHWKHLGT
jgi:hypothetical protein